MKKYTIDFEAWTTVEATDMEHAFSIGQVIINACVDDLKQAGIDLEMVVRDDGVEEE
jgi:hypothetical protein